MKKQVLYLLPDRFGVCRLDSGAPLPDWLEQSSSFFSVTGTADETSLVCREDLIPGSYISEKGFRILKVEGPLDFSLTGILSSLLTPLASGGISVFAVSTYDTDYILVKEEILEQAIDILKDAATVIQ